MPDTTSGVAAVLAASNVTSPRPRTPMRLGRETLRALSEVPLFAGLSRRHLLDLRSACQHPLVDLDGLGRDHRQIEPIESPSP